MKSLPPVSPTIAVVPYEPTFAPTVSHMPLKTSVEPVKWIPASSGLASAVLPIVAPEPYTRLITPSGRPAACISRIR